MNAQQRKQISKLIGDMEQIQSDIETIRDEEQEKYDNMSEGLQSGEKGEAIQTAIDTLTSAVDSADAARSYQEEASQ